MNVGKSRGGVYWEAERIQKVRLFIAIVDNTPNPQDGTWIPIKLRKTLTEHRCNRRVCLTAPIFKQPSAAE